MSLDKPWRKEFKILLQHMMNAWQGNVDEPDKNSIDNTYIYPTYTTTIDGIQCEVEISESARLAWSGADDNIEYLRIKITQQHKLNIIITRETFMDKAKKAMHVAKEFQTGNKKFDDKFYIRLKSDEDKAFMSRIDVQEAILNITPFTIIELSDIGMRWVQEITNKKQFAFADVERYMHNMVKLAKCIQNKI